MCHTKKIGYLTAAVMCLNSCSAVARWFLRCHLVLSHLCRQKLLIVWLGAICLVSATAGACRAQSVLTYHGSSDRHGQFHCSIAELAARPLAASRPELSAALFRPCLHPATLLAAAGVFDSDAYRRY